MKHKGRSYFFLILLSSIIFLPTYGQGWIVSNVIKATTIDPQYSVIDNQNNLYVIAPFNDTIYSPYSIVAYSSPQKDLFLFKFSSTGTVLWYRRIGSTGLETAGGITLDGDNNCFVTGSFYKNCRFTPTDSLINTGNSDIFLAKYSSDGMFQWAKRVGSSTTLQSSIDLKYNGNNHILMAGFFKDSLIIGSSISDRDILLGNAFTSSFVAQFDLSGNHIWSNRYLGSNNATRIRRIDLSQNGYYFGGYLQGSLYLDIDTIASFVPTTYDAFIYKTDFNGNGQWVRRIRGSLTENFKSLTTDEYDNVYILGNYNSATIYVDSTETLSKTYAGNVGGYDTFIGKYNRSGILQWFIRKGSSARDVYNDFVVRNNLIYATGYFANQIIFNEDTLRTSNGTNEDAFVAAFNEIGNAIAGVSIVGTGNYNDAGTIVNMDANARAYVSGSYRSQQIQIGNDVYTSNNVDKSDLFFAIYQHPLHAVFTKQVKVSCNGLSDGMLQATPYFGKPPYTYTWGHDANLHTNTAENLPAGNYTVTIKDANNEEASISAIISEPQPLAVNAAVTPVTCYNLNTGAVDITVTGGTKTTDYVYGWTTLDGSGVIPQNQDQTGLTNGTYSVNVTDDHLCSLDTSFIVIQPGKIVFTGSTTTNLTFPPGDNGAIDLQISGGNTPYTTQWTGPSGFTSTSEDLTGLTLGGLYSVELSDSKSCLADTSLPVDDGTTLIALVNSKTPVLCFGDDNGSAEITVINGVPPYNFQWSDGIPITQLNIRTGMKKGPYQVIVTDAALPVPHMAQTELTIDGPTAVLALFPDPEDLRCYGDESGVVNLTVSGGTLPFRYLWNTGYTGEDLVDIPGGSYSVTVTDTNNCSVQGNTEVGEPASMGLSITGDTEIKCFGENTGSATANVTGGIEPYSYLWNDPGTQVTQTAVQLTARTYSVTATDLNNCSITENVLIDEPDSISISTQLIPPSCSGYDDAALIPTVSGGTPQFSYVWSNNVFQKDNVAINAGSYSLTVTDANNCSDSAVYVVVDPLPVVINQVDSMDASCFGATDGSIHVAASGGTGSLSYSADNGLTFGPSPDISPMPAGIYTVVVRDFNDCSSLPASITVNQPEEIIFDTVIVTDASCYGYTDGSVAITALGGSGIFEYSADNGASYVASSTIGSLVSGSYQLVVKDDVNCLSAAYPAEIGPDEEFSVDTIEVVRGSSDNPLGSVTIDNSGGISPVSFVIIPDSSSNTSGVFIDLVPLDYRLFAMDANSCKSNELMVSLPEPPESELSAYDAFSPNGDGKNDVWNIPGIDNYPNCSVKIFNTWGVAVFTSKGYGIPWDGKYKGNDLPSGTYYYVIDPGDGSGELTGPVSIVK